MTIGERVKMLRLEAGLTQEELSERCGYSSRSSINKIETGGRGISHKMVEKLAAALGCSQWFLLGFVDEVDGDFSEVFENATSIPIVGDIACGNPIEAVENIVGDVPVVPKMRNGEYLAFRVRGDSMAPLILDGDLAIIHRQPDALDGQIVVALVDGKRDALCKTFHTNAAGVVLLSKNLNYEPVFIPKERADDDLLILGRVVEIRREL